MHGRRWRAQAIVGSAALCLLAACGGDGWERTEIGTVEVRDDAQGDVLVIGPHCSDDARATVDESDASIEVGLELSGDHHGDCYTTVEVRLAAPVGDRTIIDAATGEPANVGTHP